MRATSLAVTALAAALLLTACGDDGDDDSDDTSRDSTACTIDDVGIEVGPANAAPAAGDTGNVPVTVTNHGAECTLDGFPAVDLRTGGSSSTVPVDEAAKATKQTLAGDASTSFAITYVRGEEGGEDSLAVKTVRISLPGSPDAQDFPWTFGDVALKDAASGAPDASVGPFQQTGD
ncbi:DUF4232 domain-containing protein [Streptomyces blattellae]|uniref:DUF4232 domain-containing protein n=1 Tax=Streptomyces blattellae TaxID=2569855 RepID=UPI0012B6B733|nr:DUF4232 domain-containing protein [Streptomyces blattellae]